MSRNPIKKGERLKISVVGDSHGNPGPAVSVFLFVHNDIIINEGYTFNGTTTNNIAEYHVIFNA